MRSKILTSIEKKPTINNALANTEYRFGKMNIIGCCGPNISGMVVNLILIVPIEFHNPQRFQQLDHRMTRI